MSLLNRLKAQFFYFSISLWRLRFTEELLFLIFSTFDIFNNLRLSFNARRFYGNNYGWKRLRITDGNDCGLRMKTITDKESLKIFCKRLQKLSTCDIIHKVYYALTG